MDGVVAKAINITAYEFHNNKKQITFLLNHVALIIFLNKYASIGLCQSYQHVRSYFAIVCKYN
jgi:hypothetical protein